jgi:leucyl/phenylalanyl-tRNA--protein transferase
MSGRDTSSPAEILARYAGGFFPLYDLADRFYWERLSIRAVIPLTSEVVAHARKMAHREAGRFEIRYTTSLELIITALQNERIKPRSWVRTEVATIYRTLHRAGLLQTVEAWDRETGTLMGGLVGLVLPGVFVAETMFGVAPDASKICLCRLVEDAFAAGHKMIDVQTPHHLDENGLPRARHGRTPHPCVRLGEEVITHARFMRWMQAAMKEAFAGTLTEWLQIAAGIARGRTGALALEEVTQERLRAAWPMLRGNVTRAVAGNVESLLNKVGRH